MLTTPAYGYCSAPHDTAANYLCSHLLFGSLGSGWCPIHPHHEQRDEHPDAARRPARREILRERG